MAQPGVAREPSMEEILASIRKIIESNDPASEKEFGASQSLAYADEGDDEIHLTIEDEAQNAAAIFAANDHPASPAPQPMASHHEQPATKTVSLADLAARVRATVDRGEIEPARPSQPMAEAQLAVSAPASVAESPLMTSRLAGLRNPSMPPADMVERPPVARSAPVDLGPAASDAPVTASLLSDESGALVARSFGELAAVVDGQQRRSLDEMAEELLRPMLREWLDDNLPTLVERLVREEIERVARGPRR